MSALKERCEKETERLKGSKRVKDVFDNAMVAHLWSNQSQGSARNASKNFYFDGDTIYSYGGHFPIARHIVNKRKQKAILFTTRGYSMTTAGHIKDVRWALRGRNELVFNVPEVNRYGLSDNKAILDDYGRRIVAIGEKIPRARQNKTGLINQLKNLVAEANSYAKFMGQRRLFTVDIEKEKQKAAAINAKYENDRKARTVKRQAELDAQMEECREKLALWITGADIPYMDIGQMQNSSNPVDREVKLRIVDRNGVAWIETSRGAECPLNHALRILPFVRSGREFIPNGHTIHLGHFSVSKIDAAGNVTAGCHFITRAEIERIAAQVGAGVPVIDGVVVLVEDAYDKPAE